jgi:hypothetical protein
MSAMVHTACAAVGVVALDALRKCGPPTRHKRLATRACVSARDALSCDACAPHRRARAPLRRRYRDFVTRVVCCYSTDTSSEAGDATQLEQELAELLAAPEEGGGADDDSDGGESARGRRGARGRQRGAARGAPCDDDGDDASCCAHSALEEASGALMRPVSTPPPPGAAEGTLQESPVRARARARALLRCVVPRSTRVCAHIHSRAGCWRVRRGRSRLLTRHPTRRRRRLCGGCASGRSGAKRCAAVRADDAAAACTRLLTRVPGARRACRRRWRARWRRRSSRQRRLRRSGALRRQTTRASLLRTLAPRPAASSRRRWRRCLRPAAAHERHAAVPSASFDAAALFCSQHAAAHTCRCCAVRASSVRARARAAYCATSVPNARMAAGSLT